MNATKNKIMATNTLTGVVAAVTLLASSVSFLMFIAAWQQLHFHLPVLDMFLALPSIQAALDEGLFSTTFDMWFAPHSGAHRIAGTRLLMFVDFKYFGGINHSIYVTAWLSVAVLVFVSAASFRSTYPNRNTALVFGLGLTLLFLSNRGQLWALLHPLNNSWYVALAASAFALWLVARKPAAPSILALALVYLCCIVGAFSNFAGVIVWLLLPLLILVRDFRKGVVAALLSGIFVALYLQGISSDNDLAAHNPEVMKVLVESPEFAKAIEEALGQQSTPSALDNTVKFVSSVTKKTSQYLAAPFPDDNKVLGLFLCAFSVLLVLLSAAKMLIDVVRKQYRYDTWLEVSLAMAAICLGVAIATQLGRTLIAEPASTRYRVVVMIYWLNICGLTYYFGSGFSGGMRRMRHSQWLAIYMVLCLSLSVLFYQRQPDALLQSINLSETAVRVEVLESLGLLDFDMRRVRIPEGAKGYVAEFDMFLEKNGLAYSRGSRRRVPMDSSIECAHVEFKVRASSIDGILRIAATIDDYWANVSRMIPVSDRAGNVVGYIYPSRHGREAQHPWLPLLTTKWEGYVTRRDSSNEALYLHYSSAVMGELPCAVWRR